MTSTETTDTHPFSPADFDRLTTEYNEIQDFKEFVLDRFKAFAAANEQMDVDAEIQRGGGYVTFEIDEHTLFTDYKDITIYRKTAGDGRDYGSVKSYRLSKEFLFKTSEQEADYAQYLIFKKKVFGSN